MNGGRRSPSAASAIAETEWPKKESKDRSLHTVSPGTPLMQRNETPRHLPLSLGAATIKPRRGRLVRDCIFRRLRLNGFLRWQGILARLLIYAILLPIEQCLFSSH